MAVKRGKSQARRNGGHSGGLPGWAWLVLGIVITLAVILLAPKLLKPDGADGFIRPRPNPDAQPAATRGADGSVAPTPRDGGELPKPVASADGQPPQYDFYTVLPGQEVAMSDAELAASARAEEDRQRALAAQQQRQTDAADLAADADANNPALPAPVAAPASPAVPAAATADNQARYILQAGAFGASGDAEAIKARIALLGLNARVESAAIGGKTVYRVRMGPYGTATELAEAKARLGNGGLPAMAIKAQ
ncbi:MAG: SPOR domain-containing protein [Luteimonas sp.]